MPRPGLLEIARRRAPGATLIRGELQTLPFDDDMFDAVSGFNSLQYAADPIAALQEAKRVTCPGGRILALVWSAADMCELAPHLRSLGALMPAPPPGTPGPFALCGRDALEEFSAAAGLEVAEVSDVPCTFAYPDTETAIKALSSAGPSSASPSTPGQRRFGTTSEPSCRTASVLTEATRSTTPSATR